MSMFSASIVALVTPMKADLSLDFQALQRLVDWHVESGTSAMVLSGTTGESASLAPDEYEDLLRAALAYADGRIPVIAGAGTVSTAATIDLARRAQQAGVQGLLVVTPYYYRPTQEGLYRHYMSVAEAVELPLLLYNVPGRTAVDLLPDTVARLSAHQRIVAIKEAVPDANRVQELLSKAPRMSLLSGDDASAARSMMQGAAGVISVVANVAPAQVAALCAACIAGRSKEAEAIDRRLAPLYEALFLESNPIPVKWALARMGMIGEAIRLPLTPLSPEAGTKVGRALAAAVENE